VFAAEKKFLLDFSSSAFDLKLQGRNLPFLDLRGW